MKTNQDELQKNIRDLARNLEQQGWDRLRGLRLLHAIKEAQPLLHSHEALKAARTLSAELIETVTQKSVEAHALADILSQAYRVINALERPVTATAQQLPPLARLHLVGPVKLPLAQLGRSLKQAQIELLSSPNLTKLASLAETATQPQVLLAEADWILSLPAEQRQALADEAGKALGWVVLTDPNLAFAQQVELLHQGVSHFIEHPVSPERIHSILFELLMDSHSDPFRVILVDDEQSALMFGSKVLRDAGMEVLPSEDPLLVLDFMDEFRPDVLVVDLEMPTCRGPELVTLIRQRERFANLPVIYLTAWGDREHRLAARKTAAEDFLQKPIDPEMLTITVTAQARRQRHLQYLKECYLADQARAMDSLEQLRGAFDHHAIISIADANGIITEVNDLFCAISGYSRAELIGKSHRVVRSTQHPPAFYQDLWATIASGKVWQGDVCNQRKDGSLYWVQSTIVPFLDDEGRPYQYFSTRTDITELKRQQAALEQVLEQAEAASKAKTDFLSHMSHELRTPLNAVIGFSQLLLKSSRNPLDDKQKSQVQHINQSGEHLLQLINEVLDLARIESGKLALNFQDVELCHLVADCLSQAAPDAAVRQLTLTMDNTCQNGQIFVRADPLRLRQVVLNLLSNAIKYNQEQGRITLSARREDNTTVVLSINDTGLGIPLALQDQVFQPFNRLGAETSETPGTGIGLTICQQLITAMGGEIGFNSQPGTGSEFWIKLPLSRTPKAPKVSPAQAVSTMKEAGPGQDKDKPGCCVLYVEDNPSNTLLMEAIFDTLEGYTLQLAADAEEALRLAFDTPPGLILLDVNLPGMDGIEATRQLKADSRTAHIPVVMVSADAMPETIAQARAAGAEEYLTKPFDIPQTLALIRKLCHDPIR